MRLNGWQGVGDRLTWLSWRVLLIAVALGLLGGMGVAIAGASEPIDLPAQGAEACTEPPCFDFDLENVRLSDVPGILWLPIYLVALLLSVPSALASLWDVAHRRWKDGGRRLLPFAGLLLFFVGTEIIPHLLLPCAALPWVCEDLPGQGRDITAQWHQLHHMLAGAVPMAALHWLAVRRWRPDITER